MPSSGPDFTGAMVDLSRCSRALTPPLLRFMLLLPCHSTGAGQGRVVWALALYAWRLPRSSVFRRFGYRDALAGEGWGDAEESLWPRPTLWPASVAAEFASKGDRVPVAASWTRRSPASSSSVSPYLSLPALISRLSRSLALMVSSRSVVARSRNWSLAHWSISLPCVSRIEHQRDELFEALPIGWTVSSGVITSLEE
jgi:hypothetical protein